MAWCLDLIKHRNNFTCSLLIIKKTYRLTFSGRYIVIKLTQKIVSYLHLLAIQSHFMRSFFCMVPIVGYWKRHWRRTVVDGTILRQPFFFSLLRWGETCGTGPLTGPLSVPQMKHDWIWSSGGIILTGENRRTPKETCPSDTLPTTNPTWTALGANPGLRGEKPAANRLSYGTAETST
jgi:hypothetical protein